MLDSEVYVHQSRVNYKPGFGGAPFHWHSDFETWHSEDGMPRPRAFSVSISLTENHPFNGPLMVMPGTHKTFVPTVGATPQDYHKESLRVAAPSVGSPDRAHLTRMAEEHGIEQITGPAGSAVMFDSNLLHGSNGNLSPFARSNVFIVYNSVENTLEAPYAADAPRPQYLSNREFPSPGASRAPAPVTRTRRRTDEAPPTPAMSARGRPRHVPRATPRAEGWNRLGRLPRGSRTDRTTQGGSPSTRRLHGALENRPRAPRGARTPTGPGGRRPTADPTVLPGVAAGALLPHPPGKAH